MKYISLILLIAYSSSTLGGASGYVYQGKTYYLFKDGVAVDQNINLKSKTSRGPASVSATKVLFFTEDEVARCYYWAPDSGSKPDKNIHCLKKSELK